MRKRKTYNCTDDKCNHNVKPRTFPSGENTESTLPTSDDLIREIGGPSDVSTKDYLNAVRGE